MNLLKKKVVLFALVSLFATSCVQCRQLEETVISDNEKTDTQKLFNAIESRNVEGAKAAIAAGANIEAKDAYGKTPLCCAATRYYSVACVEIRRGSFELVTLLVDNGAKCASVPLHEVFSFEIFQILIERGANVNVRSANGDTLLHHVSSRGEPEWMRHRRGCIRFYYCKEDLEESLEIAKLLVRNGADREATNKNGSTPLHCAAANSNLRVVRFLVEQKANIEATDCEGQTPLFIAVTNGNLEVVEFLVKRKANIETTDKHGNTLLRTAGVDPFRDFDDDWVPKWQRELVEYLLSIGCTKVNHRDEDRPLMY